MLTKEYLICFWLSILLAVFLLYRKYPNDRIMAIYGIALAFSNLVMYGYRSKANAEQVSKWLLAMGGLQVFFLCLSVYFGTTGKIQTAAGYLLVVATIFMVCLFFYIFSENTFGMLNDKIIVNDHPLSLGVKILYLVLSAAALLLLTFQNSLSNIIWPLLFLLVYGICDINNIIVSWPQNSVFLLMLVWMLSAPEKNILNNKIIN